MNLILIDISPILLFLLEFFTYFALRNAHFFSVPILLKILLAKFINAYTVGSICFYSCHNNALIKLLLGEELMLTVWRI